MPRNNANRDTGCFNALPTPCYVVDTRLLTDNLKRLKYVADSSGAKILLAQKAFSMYSLYPLIGAYLNGAASSGLYEALLADQHMPGENHVFSPAYPDGDFDEIARICCHIVFNSFAQWQKYRERALDAGAQCGIRINPELSTQQKAIYDPCAPHSRLGVTAANFRRDLLDGVTGLHFHTLCEQNADALQATLAAAEDKFGDALRRMQWLNMGGGHHITRPDYDVDLLINELRRVREKYGVQVYLEPGEAVVLNAGFLVASVLDIVDNGMPIAILDASAACHMPDVLEVPYRPHVIGAGAAGEKARTYRLAGPTCLAGDIIGDYSFDTPIGPGTRLVFTDMALYTMVKNNTFNGMPLPAIAINDGEAKIVKQFGYGDFKGRLS